MTLTLADAFADLLLGSTCVGCQRPGRILCPECREGLPGGAWPAWPSPVPAGLVEPWAAAAYATTVRAMVIGLKERGQLGLERPLSRLLALAAGAGSAPGRPVVLVPVPSRRATVIARGHDPTATLTRLAARQLARSGHVVVARRLLRLRVRVADQAGLGAAERAVNLAGSMEVRAAAVRRMVRASPDAVMVVCDDVLTTGSTAREAQRALQVAGLEVVRIAVVAATPRRHQAGHGEYSGDLLSSGGGGD